MHMKKFLLPFCVLFTLASPLFAQGSFGEDRAGTEGFQFTKIAVDPRSAAMGNSNMADAYDASSLYWNPALSARLEGSNVMLSHTRYFAGINLDYFSVVQKVGDFALGGSVQYLSSGEITETTEFQPFGTGRTFATHHISAGATVSHEVTELFSYGITFRYLMEKIEEIQYQSGAIDFGFSYLVGDTGLRFAVGINNFGFDSSPEGTTTRESLNGVEVIEPDEQQSLPTRFLIGAAYDLIDNDENSLVVTAQITNPSDNAEQFNVGAEYGFMKQFFVRTGYEFGIEERKIPSFGAGVELPFGNRIIRADYAYSLYERLGEIHRIAINVAL
jgi:long-subunit fatty acid transport protein